MQDAERQAKLLQLQVCSILIIHLRRLKSNYRT